MNSQVQQATFRLLGQDISYQRLAKPIRSLEGTPIEAKAGRKPDPVFSHLIGRPLVVLGVRNFEKWPGPATVVVVGLANGGNEKEEGLFPLSSFWSSDALDTKLCSIINPDGEPSDEIKELIASGPLPKKTRKK